MNTYIRNIVIACPGEWIEYVDEHGNEQGRMEVPLATFYTALLGMRIIREDWLKIATDPDAVPQLAFGDGPAEYRPPRWGDPDADQQLHLDVFVADLDSADELVIGLGATRLEDRGEYRSYLDPDGHPFCLYPDPAAPGDASPGRIGRVVFDCFSPRALASFYEPLLGMQRVLDSADRVEIAPADATAPMLAFQHAVFAPPRWPDPQYPQQLHLDIYTDDGPSARELVERLGAIRLPAMGGSAPVYADPAGHPFCLCEPYQ